MSFYTFKISFLDGALRFVLALASSCYMTTYAAEVKTSTVSIVKFRPFSGESFARNINDNSSCDLHFDSIANPTKDILTLGGRVRCPELGSRSLLLYSEDRGGHWQEVGESIWGRMITNLHFATKTVGFGLNSHQEEGPGPETIIVTKNAGLSWVTMRELPKGESPHHAIVDTFNFTTVQDGTFSIAVTTGGDMNLQLSFRTRDGGINWEYVSAAKRSDTPNDKAVTSLKIIEENNLVRILDLAITGAPKTIAVFPSVIPIAAVAAPKTK